MSYIGRGERAAQKILSKLYPGWVWRPQVPLTDLPMPPQIDPLHHISERIRRTSIDWVAQQHGHTWHESKKIAVHVDDVHHLGERTSKIDALIDRLLKEIGIPSLRIREGNCPELFKDIVSDISIQEVKDEIAAWRIKF